IAQVQLKAGAAARRTASSRGALAMPAAAPPRLPGWNRYKLDRGCPFAPGARAGIGANGSERRGVRAVSEQDVGHERPQAAPRPAETTQEGSPAKIAQAEALIHPLFRSVTIPTGGAIEHVAERLERHPLAL